MIQLIYQIQTIFSLCIPTDYVPIQTAPSNFSAEGISDSEVLLTWVPSDFICDVQGYMIEYTDLNNIVEFSVVGGATDNVVVTGLRADTPYRFSIKPLLLVDRNLDYGVPTEGITLPYSGKVSFFPVFLFICPYVIISFGNSNYLIYKMRLFYLRDIRVTTF